MLRSATEIKNIIEENYYSIDCASIENAIEKMISNGQNIYLCTY